MVTQNKKRFLILQKINMISELPPVIEFKNKLTNEQVNQLVMEVIKQSSEDDYIAKWGRYPGELISNQRHFDYYNNSVLTSTIGPVLDQIFGKYRVIDTVRQILYLPWDIHTDWCRDVVDLQPWYNVLIPLESADSQTFIFEQQANYNDFYVYKEQNPKLAMPMDIKLFKDRLAHCWEEDQQWLSILKITSTWNCGDVIAFQRQHFHSSDYFPSKNIKQKVFLQLLIDRA